MPRQFQAEQSAIEDMVNWAEVLKRLTLRLNVLTNENAMQSIESSFKEALEDLNALPDDANHTEAQKKVDEMYSYICGGDLPRRSNRHVSELIGEAKAEREQSGKILTEEKIQLLESEFKYALNTLAALTGNSQHDATQNRVDRIYGELCGDNKPRKNNRHVDELIETARSKREQNILLRRKRISEIFIREGAKLGEKVSQLDCDQYIYDNTIGRQCSERPVSVVSHSKFRPAVESQPDNRTVAPQLNRRGSR